MEKIIITATAESIEPVSYTHLNHKQSDTQEKQLNTEKIIKSDFEDISGDYISSTGEKATVAKNDQNWRISYNTDEGNAVSYTHLDVYKRQVLDS